MGSRTGSGPSEPQFEDFQAEIGKALLPAFEALIDAGPSLLTLFEGVVPAIGSAAGAFSGFVTTHHSPLG